MLFLPRAHAPSKESSSNSGIAGPYQGHTYGQGPSCPLFRSHVVAASFTSFPLTCYKSAFPRRGGHTGGILLRGAWLGDNADEILKRLRGTPHLVLWPKKTTPNSERALEGKINRDSKDDKILGHVVAVGCVSPFFYYSGSALHIWGQGQEKGSTERLSLPNPSLLPLQPKAYCLALRDFAPSLQEERKQGSTEGKKKGSGERLPTNFPRYPLTYGSKVQILFWYVELFPGGLTLSCGLISASLCLTSQPSGFRRL